MAVEGAEGGPPKTIVSDLDTFFRTAFQIMVDRYIANSRTALIESSKQIGMVVVRVVLAMEVRIYLSNPKPGHITGESGRGARWSGRAGSGKIAYQQNYSSRK